MRTDIKGKKHAAKVEWVTVYSRYLVRVKNATVTNRNVYCISQELVGQLLNFFGPCGGEEKVLSVSSQLTDNFSYLR